MNWRDARRVTLSARAFDSPQSFAAFRGRLGLRVDGGVRCGKEGCGTGLQLSWTRDLSGRFSGIAPPLGRPGRSAGSAPRARCLGTVGNGSSGGPSGASRSRCARAPPVVGKCSSGATCLGCSITRIVLPACGRPASPPAKLSVMSCLRAGSPPCLHRVVALRMSALMTGGSSLRRFTFQPGAA